MKHILCMTARLVFNRGPRIFFRLDRPRVRFPLDRIYSSKRVKQLYWRCARSLPPPSLPRGFAIAWCALFTFRVERFPPRANRHASRKLIGASSRVSLKINKRVSWFRLHFPILPLWILHIDLKPRPPGKSDGRKFRGITTRYPHAWIYENGAEKT